MLQFIINVQFFFSMAFFSSPHKAKLGSKIKKLFWQFHYFSKAAAHITEHIASGAPDLFFYRNLDIDQRFKIWVAKMVLMQDLEFGRNWKSACANILYAANGKCSRQILLNITDNKIATFFCILFHFDQF